MPNKDSIIQLVPASLVVYWVGYDFEQRLAYSLVSDPSKLLLIDECCMSDTISQMQGINMQEPLYYSRLLESVYETTSSNLSFEDNYIRRLRDVSVLGITPGAVIMKDWNPDEYIGVRHVNPRCSDHLCTYDLETVFTPGTDVLIGVDIIRLTMLCSCGLCATIGGHKVTRLLEKGPVDSIVETTSYTIALRFMKILLEHRPQYLVAHNGYAFDNRVLAYHLARDQHYSSFFKNLGSYDKGKDFKIKLLIDIPGIFNVCSYKYIKTSL